MYELAGILWNDLPSDLKPAVVTSYGTRRVTPITWKKSFLSVQSMSIPNSNASQAQKVSGLSGVSLLWC
jgi:hypothetical protein